MDISKHTIVRCQQRAIPMHDIDLIIQFGKTQCKPGSAIEYSVSKRDINKMLTHLKHLINKLDKITNKVVLVIDNQVVTFYQKNH